MLECHNRDRRRAQQESLPRGTQKYWEVTAHCESLPFPKRMPDVSFHNSASDYHFQRLDTDEVPDQQKVKLVTQAHYRVLAKLNQSQLQVKNFILPVQLMKMKYMDPFSRQRIIEELCKYFSFQTGLRSIVLEQAELKLEDLCRLLVAIAENSRVKSLFLWHVLDSCDKPFRGPLQSEIVLDDLPRIPYTYNPGGRKYLRELKTDGLLEQQSSKGIGKLLESGRIQSKLTTRSYTSLAPDTWSDTSRKSLENPVVKVDSNHLLLQLIKLEDKVKKCLYDPSSDSMICEIIKKEFVNIAPVVEEHAFSQSEVGIQCKISQDFEDVTHVPQGNIDDNTKNGNQTELESRLLKSTRLGFCKKYLKYYENTGMGIGVLRDIYLIALSGLTNLSQLAVNYSMLADGTGNALLSIGSIAKGRLKHLKLLCEPDDVPSLTHQLYDDNALQAIPDLVWYTVEQECPELKVHIVCVSMSTYDVIRCFVTKHVPLNSFHMENGFCPTILNPQLNIYCTLKCLWLDHSETLEHVNITLWHTTGRIDGSLEKLIQKTKLHSFEYNGPILYKASVNKLCEAALQCTKLRYFKLMIQPDPCFPHNARELSSDLYNQYRLKFQDKSIQFMLGTFNS